MHIQTDFQEHIEVHIFLKYSKVMTFNFIFRDMHVFDDNYLVVENYSVCSVSERRQNAWTNFKILLKPILSQVKA